MSTKGKLSLVLVQHNKHLTSTHAVRNLDNHPMLLDLKNIRDTSLLDGMPNLPTI